MFSCCFVFFLCPRRRRSYLRSGTDLLFSKTHVRSGIQRSGKKKKKKKNPTKPPHDCRCCCCVSVCDHDDKQTEGFSLPFHFFQMSHDADQTLWRLALNVPRLECLPLMRGKKQSCYWSSCSAPKCKTAHERPGPPLMMILDLVPFFGGRQEWGGGCGGASVTDELRKTGLFKNHTHVKNAHLREALGAL